MLASILFICAGASAGALLRWGFNNMLNFIFPALPLGTLTVNWLGGLLMGFFMAMFTALPGLAPEWRLFLITGFLGSLTTFSAFSGEMGTLLLQGKWLLCACGIGLHVFGSIAMFFLGLAAFEQLRKLVGI